VERGKNGEVRNTHYMCPKKGGDLYQFLFDKACDSEFESRKVEGSDRKDVQQKDESKSQFADRIKVIAEVHEMALKEADDLVAQMEHLVLKTEFVWPTFRYYARP
jgi:hypothetical protein